MSHTLVNCTHFRFILNACGYFTYKYHKGLHNTKVLFHYTCPLVPFQMCGLEHWAVRRKFRHNKLYSAKHTVTKNYRLIQDKGHLVERTYPLPWEAEGKTAWRGCRTSRNNRPNDRLPWCQSTCRKRYKNHNDQLNAIQKFQMEVSVFFFILVTVAIHSRERAKF